MKAIMRELPVVTLLSKYFAGKSINLPHVESQGEAFADYPSGAAVEFDDSGLARVNLAQAAEIQLNTSYSPFITVVETEMVEFELEVEDDYEDDYYDDGANDSSRYENAEANDSRLYEDDGVNDSELYSADEQVYEDPAKPTPTAAKAAVDKVIADKVNADKAVARQVSADKSAASKVVADKKAARSA